MLNNIYFLFFIMLFYHIVDDYYLQGILANMKQKQWWEENAPAALYKYDYIMALIEHAFSWAFMIMLPIMVFMWYYHCVNFIFYTICFCLNWAIHAIVDNTKANERKINLIVDQIIHIIQIFITWLVFSIYMGIF